VIEEDSISLMPLFWGMALVVGAVAFVCAIHELSLASAIGRKTAHAEPSWWQNNIAQMILFNGPPWGFWGFAVYSLMTKIGKKRTRHDRDAMSADLAVISPEPCQAIAVESLEHPTTITELDKEEQEQEAPCNEGDLEAVRGADRLAEESLSVDDSAKEEADDFRRDLPPGGRPKEKIDKDARNASIHGGKRGTGEAALIKTIPITVWIVPIILLAVAIFVGINNHGQRLPYGYFTFLRIVVCLAAGCIAAATFRDGKSLWATIFVLIAVLFNPFVPIEMNKDDWLFFDAVTTIVFIAHVAFVRQGRAIMRIVRAFRG